MAKAIKKQCSVREGRFVEPCEALSNCWEGPATRANGIRFAHLTHLPTGKPSRTLVTLHSGEYAKRGIALNNCPFCGVDLTATHEPPKEAPQ